MALILKQPNFYVSNKVTMNLTALPCRAQEHSSQGSVSNKIVRNLSRS
jgi:hypothetical protein